MALTPITLEVNANNYNNSYDEIVFDRMSEQSQETEWTKEDITSKR